MGREVDVMPMPSCRGFENSSKHFVRNAMSVLPGALADFSGIPCLTYTSTIAEYETEEA